jgi:hypothetical protein
LHSPNFYKNYLKERMNTLVPNRIDWKRLNFSIAVQFIAYHEYFGISFITIVCLFQPIILDALKCLVVWNIITDENGICAIVVGADNRSKSLLTYLTVSIPAVSQICNFISYLSIVTRRNLKSTPMVDSNLSSNVRSTNWHSNEDFPKYQIIYPLLSLQPGPSCIRRKVWESYY